MDNDRYFSTLVPGGGGTEHESVTKRRAPTSVGDPAPKKSHTPPASPDQNDVFSPPNDVPEITFSGPTVQHIRRMLVSGEGIFESGAFASIVGRCPWSPTWSYRDAERYLCERDLPVGERRALLDMLNITRRGKTALMDPIFTLGGPTVEGVSPSSAERATLAVLDRSFLHHLQRGSGTATLCFRYVELPMPCTVALVEEIYSAIKGDAAHRTPHGQALLSNFRDHVRSGIQDGCLPVVMPVLELQMQIKGQNDVNIGYRIIYVADTSEIDIRFLPSGVGALHFSLAELNGLLKKQRTLLGQASALLLGCRSDEIVLLPLSQGQSREASSQNLCQVAFAEHGPCVSRIRCPCLMEGAVHPVDGTVEPEHMLVLSPWAVTRLAVGTLGDNVEEVQFILTRRVLTLTVRAAGGTELTFSVPMQTATTAMPFPTPRGHALDILRLATDLGRFPFPELVNILPTSFTVEEECELEMGETGHDVTLIRGYLKGPAATAIFDGSISADPVVLLLTLDNSEEHDMTSSFLGELVLFHKMELAVDSLNLRSTVVNCQIKPM